MMDFIFKILLTLATSQVAEKLIAFIINKLIESKDSGVSKELAKVMINGIIASKANPTTLGDFTEAMQVLKRNQGIIVHCSGSPQGRGDDASTIDKWHKERGFDCIGYHFVILEDGTVQKGRPLGTKGAHCRGYNHYVGICLIGIDSFTEAQYKSLEKLIRELDAPMPNVLGHNEVSTKSCPNFDVQAFKELRLK